MICEEFRETLEQEGFEVDWAVSGKEGLQKIQSNRYSLVFLDSAMPVMDGKKVLERIRHFSQVPVALISGAIGWSGTAYTPVSRFRTLICIPAS